MEVQNSQQFINNILELFKISQSKIILMLSIRVADLVISYFFNFSMFLLTSSNINNLEWPSQGPDIDLMKNIWRELQINLIGRKHYKIIKKD